MSGLRENTIARPTAIPLNAGLARYNHSCQSICLSLGPYAAGANTNYNIEAVQRG
jgi:hypothetical protein